MRYLLLSGRFRPSLFPSTEPRAEVDLLLTGRAVRKAGSKWAGAEAIPNGFDGVGIDSEAI